MRTLFGWLLPGGAVLLGAVAVDHWASLAVTADITRGYPIVTFAVAFLLAALFHRSRVALLEIALACGTWGLAAGWPLGVTATGLVVAVGTVALFQDRGVGTPASVGPSLAVATVLALTAMVGSGGAPEVAALFAAAPSSSGLGAWSGLPPAQLLACGLALGPVVWVVARRRGPADRGLLWSLVIVMMGLRPGADPALAPLYLMAAGAALGLSVVETSYAMAYRDELTGLPGRRALMRDLAALSPPYAVAMVDVDHFKKFNDRHGHDVGDQVLRMVATRLGKSRGGLRAYRYGGEEFTLLLPGKTRDGALEALEGARTAVEHASFAVRSWRRPRTKPAAAKKSRKKPEKPPRHLSVTVSIGVSDSTAAPHPDQVLEKADKALYRAKRAGRNRVAK